MEITEKLEQALLFDVVTEVVKVKQIVMERTVEYSTKITSTQVAGELGIREIGDEANEVLLMVALNTKNEVNAIHRVFSGNVNSCMMYPAEIFRSAIMNNATRILIYHNHPSGDTDPSEADIRATKRMEEAGELLGIVLLDHIIVTAGTYLSLKEYGAI